MKAHLLIFEDDRKRLTVFYRFLETPKKQETLKVYYEDESSLKFDEQRKNCIERMHSCEDFI